MKTINLTLKKNIGTVKASRKNIEISTRIDNKEAMIDILKDLGYHVSWRGV